MIFFIPIIAAGIFAGGAAMYLKKVIFKAPFTKVLIAAAVFGMLFQFLFQIYYIPALGFNFPQTWFSILFAVLFGVGLAMIVDVLFLNKKLDLIDSIEVLFNTEIFLMLGIGFGISLVIFWVVYLVSSGELFRSKDYRNIIGEMKKMDHIQEVDEKHLSSIRLVPYQTASTLASKVLGQSKDGSILGSQLSLDHWSTGIQEVNGELWWIFPLDFSGFFEWKSRKNVPGYIRVNAHDPKREAEFIDADPATGEKLNLVYTPNSYFGSWLERKIYFQYPDHEINHVALEVDEKWKPYYIITLTRPSIGMSGDKISGIIIFDPQTGEMEFKDMKDIPDWIDWAVPLDLTLDYLNWWGEYVHGWFNSVFAMRDVQIPTYWNAMQDLWFVQVGNENYWFTGMTSASSADQSLVGAVFVNTRTGEASYFSMHGTDENGVAEAVDSALGADSARWEPTAPIPYNLHGVPSWVVPIISSEGVYQKLAIVDMNNINTIAIDRDLNRAVEKYKFSLRRNTSQPLDSDSDEISKTGFVSVSRVGSTVNDGTKIFYIMIAGKNNKVFTTNADSPRTRAAALVKAGDKVKLEYLDSSDKMIPIDSIQIQGINLE
ncbi:MAG: hypothetical protein OEZ34_09440 [Spirochaetia bacterium]|nr:hypothetical protein [Spirochaetia bacterium]